MDFLRRKFALQSSDRNRKESQSTFFLKHASSLSDLTSDFFRNSIWDSPKSGVRKDVARVDRHGKYVKPVTYAGSLACNLDLCGSKRDPRANNTIQVIPKIGRVNYQVHDRRPMKTFQKEIQPHRHKIHINHRQKQNCSSSNNNRPNFPSNRTYAPRIDSSREMPNINYTTYRPALQSAGAEIDDTGTQQNLNDTINEMSVRDRSKVGLRHSLPFVIGSATSSGLSGSSDTQSQGSGGTDCKSESLSPEGLRQGSSSSGMSIVSSSAGGSSGGIRSIKKSELSQTSGERESRALRQEVETLRAEITKARQTILHMQEREKKLKERMGDNAVRGVTERTYAIGGSCSPPRIENLSLGDKRPSALVRRYAHLYDQTRLDALDALDALPDLRQADELKAKLLYSVVVLAFRSVSNTVSYMREEIRNVLQLAPVPHQSATQDSANGLKDSPTHLSRSVELAISAFCAYNIDNHDLTKNVDEVCEQIWATLYDYPCLKTSEALLQYAKACVRVAWGLVNQSPPYVIEYETRTFREDLHVRFYTSDPANDIIKSYLWPTLLEGAGGKCVHQGVVIT